MSTVRKIRTILKSQDTYEGAGVHLKRAFGNQHAPQLDPFLLLDDFHSDNPADYQKGFPWHPHRGIETITYVLNGEVTHGDSLGNTGVISAGDVQWMTAGSGIVHQEMPAGQADGKLWGLQLWANLPASHKMMPPRYRDITQAQIPEVQLNSGVTIKIICGTVNEVNGPVDDVVIDPEYLDVTIPPQTDFVHPLEPGYTAFAYVLDGKGYFEPERGPHLNETSGKKHFDFQKECLIGPENLIIFEDGDYLAISTATEAVRFLLIAGKPIQEPVAWYGPIVMNTQAELKTAFEEYQTGTFLKHRKKP